MKFQITQTFDDYVALGDASTEELLHSDSPMVSALRQFLEFFTRTLWSGEVEVSAQQAFLSMNAYMLYTGAVRIGLTGHVVATYPLFRTALESACYAYLMGNDPLLEAIWVNRHASEDAGKACRRKFASAVYEAADLIGASQPTQETASWIKDCYQAAIDFGAHPNPRSVLRHLGHPEDGGDHWLVPLTGLYGPNSSKVGEMLMACLDYGLVIAVVLAHCLKSLSEQVATELSRLNELKNHLETAHFVRRSQTEW